MNETNKFKDDSGDSIQAISVFGNIRFYVSGWPDLNAEQVDELIKQLTELNDEVKAKQ